MGGRARCRARCLPVGLGASERAETVALALTDNVSHDLVFQAASGHNSGNIIGRRIPNGRGVIGKVVEEGEDTGSIEFSLMLVEAFW